MAKKIRIGSRGSKLALWQANFTKSILEDAGFHVVIEIIKTKGDRIQHLSFDKIEGKGFFTKELEDALLDKAIDMAVHSCKDMPSEDVPGLTIAAFSKSANPADLLIVKKPSADSRKLWNIKEEGVVGTSSARRKSQLLSYRPDLVCKDIRGNVPTRLDKLHEGQFDGIVLAAAGVERLAIDLSEFVVHEFDPKVFIPAPAQGVLAFQIRKDDEEMSAIVTKYLNDEVTSEIVQKERGIMTAVGGGCQTPLGIYMDRVKDSSTVHVAYGIKNKDFSRRLLFYPSREDRSSFIDCIKKVKSNPKKIFMGTAVKKGDYFVRAMEAIGHEVISEALINFEGVEFDANFEGIDWLFFASKNGVRYFFEKVSKSAIVGIKIGAVSNGTALVLNEHGIEVDFIGQSAKMVDVAKDFKSKHNGFVVFIRAERSQRSMQKVFSENEYRDLVVYTNVMRPNISAVNADIYVFTSSLGFKSYIADNQINKEKYIVSIGSATGDTIRSFGYQCVEAHKPSLTSLAEEIFSMEFRAIRN